MHKIFNITKEELSDLYYNKQLKLKEIAEVFECSERTIIIRLKELGLEKRELPKSSKDKNKIYISRSELIKLYWLYGLSLRQVSKKLNIKYNTILNNMNRYNIKRRPNNQFVDVSEKELRKLYCEDRLTVQQVADKFKCDAHTICRKLKKYNIKELHNCVNKLTDNIGKRELYNLYIDKKLSASNIAKIVRTHKITILQLLKIYEIPARNSVEARNLLDRFGENNGSYIDGRIPLRLALRALVSYSNWRMSVFKRDNFTCKECGEHTGGNLEAHHIKPFAVILSEFLKEYEQFSPVEDKETLERLAINYKPFWDIDNGKTLCKYCHKSEYKNTMCEIKNNKECG